MEQRQQAAEHSLVDRQARLLDAVTRAFPQLLHCPRRKGNADYRHFELVAPDHLIESWEDLFVGEITGHAEHHQRVGLKPCGSIFPDGHFTSALSKIACASFTICPSASGPRNVSA